MAILVIGVFAALNQLQIAPEIVNGLFYALLAIIVGVAIVAFGGGGIQTARGYWERVSRRAETTASEIRQKPILRPLVNAARRSSAYPRLMRKHGVGQAASCPAVDSSSSRSWNGAGPATLLLTAQKRHRPRRRRSSRLADNVLCGPPG